MQTQKKFLREISLKQERFLGNKVVLETELITKLIRIQNPYVKLLP